MPKKILVSLASAVALTVLGVSSTFASTYWGTSVDLPVSHWYGGTVTITCQSGLLVGDDTNPGGLPYVNLSSPGVSVAMQSGGYGQRSVKFTVFNWNLTGSQRVRIKVPCHTPNLLGI